MTMHTDDDKGPPQAEMPKGPPPNPSQRATLKPETNTKPHLVAVYPRNIQRTPIEIPMKIENPTKMQNAREINFKFSHTAAKMKLA